ncbi:MAG: primosomal protein N' [Hyphomicrobiales bacterium]|nr:primosomal protein N' [Hyphomicrobiales bacterium]
MNVSKKPQVRVLVPLAVPKAYSYAVPEGMILAPGDVVRVPLASRVCVGVVWDSAGDGDIDEKRLRPVREHLPARPLSKELRTFIEFVSNYTLHPLGTVLRLALSAPDALKPPPKRFGYAATETMPKPMTQARKRVLESLGQAGVPLEQNLLLERAQVRAEVLRTMVKAGWLQKVETGGASETAPCDAYQFVREKSVLPSLSSDQESIVSVLREALKHEDGWGRGGARGNGFLLDGVTGSGKTEVYFEAIASVLEAGRQVLVLLPEIALTEQFLKRFTARFGIEPLVWHSGLTRARRRDGWRAVSNGSARMVVGARSALFLPFEALGLIVVDEEHEQAFKQDDGVLYHARDMAVARAWLGGFPVLLSSATPSLESLENVERGRLQHLRLGERFGGASQPDISVIDLRGESTDSSHWLGESLVSLMRETLESGDQSLLFLNRRGYAPVSLCRACGERITCPNCDVWLVEHRSRNGLLCHHCGYRRALLLECPACGEKESLVACGPGVERIAEETAALFPQARIEVLSSDKVFGARGYQGAIERILEREVDIIIGTQIIAKGHHFPHLTLVGIIDADIGLGNADLRASERSYQLLHQVIGRCGREERPGRALLQTWMPEHPVIQALARGDRDGFIEQERFSRERAGLPPFGRLVALILSDTDEQRVRDATRVLSKTLPKGDGFVLLGPAPAALYRLRGKFRYRFLLRASRSIDAQKLITDWLAGARLSSGTRLVVDVDPYWFG